MLFLLGFKDRSTLPKAMQEMHEIPGEGEEVPHYGVAGTEFGNNTTSLMVLAEAARMELIVAEYMKFRRLARNIM